MRALVTGAAGFIGSTLCDRLVAEGHDVVGVDCFTPAYDTAVKAANVDALRRSDRFELLEVDLRTAPLEPIVEDADVVFHQAALAGVRASWDDRFAEYATHNVLATQRLLEAAKAADVRRFVYASSSSIYGNALSYPTDEGVTPAPFSPYGVTKLAGEHLCTAYAHNFGLPTVALRYFTVFGPRQRPDMGVHRLIRSALRGEAFELYGDGSQQRELTYVDDVVDANVRAATSDVPPGFVCNIAGGSEVLLSTLIDLVGEVVGSPVPVRRVEAMPGDVRRNRGATDRAHQALGWAPTVSLRDGIERQLAWQRTG